MQQEWEIPMEFGGAACGTASVRREGLYVRVSCDCAMVTERVVRAYLRRGGGEIGLGVLVPEDGRLRLERRIAASQLPDGEFTAVRVTEREDGWAPWEGTVRGCQVQNGLRRQEGAVPVVAMPFSPQEPFAAMALFRLCRPLRLDGRQYLSIAAG